MRARERWASRGSVAGVLHSWGPSKSSPGSSSSAISGLDISLGPITRLLLGAHSVDRLEHGIEVDDALIAPLHVDHDSRSLVGRDHGVQGVVQARAGLDDGHRRPACFFEGGAVVLDVLSADPPAGPVLVVKQQYVALI